MEELLELKNKAGEVVGYSKISSSDREKLSSYKWYLDNEGYARTAIKEKRVRMHELVIKRDKGMVIDHINRDKLDNRRENLRTVTRSINSHNNGGLGVSFDKKNNKWEAYIWDMYKKISLGFFKEKEDAIAIRLEAKKKYYEQRGI